MNSLQQTNTPASILIVEDNPAAKKIISRMVTMQFPDAAVYLAGDGVIGVELFKKHTPDIVITDINMPGMDGVQMANEIKSLKPDTKFIVFTAYKEEQFLEQFSRIGARTYLMKPFDLEELMVAIGKCIKEKAALAISIPGLVCVTSCPFAIAGIQS